MSANGEPALPTSVAGRRFLRLSTLDQPEGARFDYWKSLHPRVDVALPDPERAAGFHGDMLLYVDGSGATFSAYDCEATICRFGQAGADSILVAAQWGGETRLRVGSGDVQVVGPGSGLYVLDTAKPITISTDRHRLSYIALPRAGVIGRLGGDMSYLRDGIVALGGDGLAGFMLEHLERMYRHGAHLDAAEAAAVMQAGTAMALGCLAGIYGSGDESMQSSRVLFEAALRHIARYNSDETLTATAIAAALGCSRAHLYRVFAEHGETVGNVVRERRLLRARHLLAAQPPASIDQIAQACGYGNAVTLSRAFKTQFGVTPARWREALTETIGTQD